MLAQFGYGILVVTFLLALYSVGIAVFGYFTKSSSLVESARRSMLLTFPLLSVAALSLITLLVRGDFSVQFVYEVTSKSMPTYLKDHRLVGRTGWLAGLLVVADVRVRVAGHPAQMGPRPRVPAVGDRRR
jgi:hypothetical protein